MEQLIESLFQAKNLDIPRIKALLQEMNPEDIAELFNDMPLEQAVQLFRLLSKGMAADVFASLDSDRQEKIVNALSDTEVGQVVNGLFADDAADFLEEMPADVVTRVLHNVHPEKRKVLNQLLQYPEDSAGSIMTTEYVDLWEDATVGEAFDVIRETGPNKETIYTCYVIRRDRMLVGAVTAKDLLLSKPAQTVSSIMEDDPITVRTTDDQETAAALFKKYDLLALPVVDKEGRLVGIITVDDIVDVIEAENTEDFEKMSAMVPSDEPYLKTSIWKMARNRIVWLLALMVSATVSGGIISHFESALAALPILTAFIPMLMDTGGNAGCQSGTLVIRGQALGEISFSDTLRALWIEFRVGLLCGIILAIVNFARVYLMNGHNLALCGAVSLTLIGDVVVANTIGALLPLLARKLHLDPAVMASPLLTTITDATALIIFFSISKGIFGI
jgi:magnesium transporter